MGGIAGEAGFGVGREKKAISGERKRDGDEWRHEEKRERQPERGGAGPAAQRPASGATERTRPEPRRQPAMPAPDRERHETPPRARLLTRAPRQRRAERSAGSPQAEPQAVQRAKRATGGSEATPEAQRAGARMGEAGAGEPGGGGWQQRRVPCWKGGVGRQQQQGWGGPARSKAKWAREARI